MGLSGSLSPSIEKLTALTSILLGNNNLSGSTPNLSPLKRLEIFFLQSNNLTGQVPNSLIGKPGLDLRTSPGNQFSSPPPS